MIVLVNGLLSSVENELREIFKKDENVIVAYLFGSRAKDDAVSGSDFDIALLLSKVPEDQLDYILHLIDKLSQVIGGDRIDLVVLNKAPPLLKYQVIKHGRVIYSRDNKLRVLFEARAIDEYLDFSRVIERYYECLKRRFT